MELMFTVEMHLAWEYFPEVPLQYFLTWMPFLLLSVGSHTFLIASESRVNTVAYIVLRVLGDSVFRIARYNGDG